MEFTLLPTKEKAIVIAMAKENICRPSKIAKAVKENLNAVGMFLNYLEEKAVVEKHKKGAYYLQDPIFEEWLKRKYGE